MKKFVQTISFSYFASSSLKWFLRAPAEKEQAKKTIAVLHAGRFLNIMMQQKAILVILLTSLAAAGCAESAEPRDATLPLLGAYLTTSAPGAEYDSKRSGTPLPGKYIVVFKKGTFLPGSRSAMRAFAGRVLNDNGIGAEAAERIYAHALTGFAGTLSAAAAARLKDDPRTEYIVQDRVITLDDPSARGKPAPGGSHDQITPWGILRVGGALDAAGKTAWVIDTGIDLNNSDLNVDRQRSATFVLRGKPTPNDEHGHGTHVAGIIAALDNDIDAVGVAAGATVVAVRVLDKNGSGSYSWVIAGVDYVAANAAAGDAANMSLGGPTFQPLDDAIVNAAALGIAFTLAAGNESDDANNHSPARANHPNVYTLSAIDSSDAFAWFSNYGNPPIDHAAPGVAIPSLKPGGGTVVYNGTSMAAPHAAGLLLTGGINADGFATFDPDGTPDPIAHR